LPGFEKAPGVHQKISGGQQASGTLVERRGLHGAASARFQLGGHFAMAAAGQDFGGGRNLVQVRRVDALDDLPGALRITGVECQADGQGRIAELHRQRKGLGKTPDTLEKGNGAPKITLVGRPCRSAGVVAGSHQIFH
jgi:hypothetical protein